MAKTKKAQYLYVSFYCNFCEQITNIVRSSFKNESIHKQIEGFFFLSVRNNITTGTSKLVMMKLLVLIIMVLLHCYVAQFIRLIISSCLNPFFRFSFLYWMYNVNIIVIDVYFYLVLFTAGPKKPPRRRSYYQLWVYCGSSESNFERICWCF